LGNRGCQEQKDTVILNKLNHLNKKYIHKDIYHTTDIIIIIMIWIWLTSLALLLIYCATQTDTPWIVITNLDVLPNGGDNIVIADGSLKYIYDDTTYLDILNCNNGDLSLINDSIASNITFSYGGLGELNSSNTYATAGPNANPKPELIFGENNTFILTFNCPSVIDNNNYYNKVDVHVM
jgi:hypothetical protein